MLGITIAMASTGTITFETAAALVLGENIGTTITAILASIGTTTASKRAAAAHAVFNVLGVMVMVIIFRPYVHFIDWLIPKGANFMDLEGGRPFVAAHIAAVHSVFNVSATLIFLPFLNQIARFVSHIIPDPDYEEPQKLEFLGQPELMPPVLAISQAYSELHKLSDIVQRQFVAGRSYILEAEENKKLREKVIKYEDISDNIQKEIMVFLCRLMERNLTQNQAVQVNCMLSAADDLESVADYCRNLVEFRHRLYENKHTLNDATIGELSEFSEGVMKLLDQMFSQMSEPAGFQQGRFEGLFRQMKELGDKIKNSHLDRIKEGVYSPLSGLTFSDMIVAMRKMMGHISAVNKALNTIPF
jgi:phosphate:Na+ symporter